MKWFLIYQTCTLLIPNDCDSPINGGQIEFKTYNECRMKIAKIEMLQARNREYGKNLTWGYCTKKKVEK